MLLLLISGLHLGAELSWADLLQTPPGYGHQVYQSLAGLASGPRPTLQIREVFAYLEKLLVQSNFI